MKTVLQELIQWTIENAFNVEAQDGTTYIAIDHEEMRNKFDGWLEKEKEQIIQAFLKGKFEGGGRFEDASVKYYDETFNEDVS
jgi:23S rRNA maturation-related 3'-5' exoribonuclease YhaM